ncbi:MAG TPA: hypothetical protein VG407_06760 [Caulobacteraceae bacterium]|jgi:hypothetical protein|nr:hypothetical protein [Caulobacteraceae bacterium]
MNTTNIEQRAAGVLNAVMCFALGLCLLSFSAFLFYSLFNRAGAIPMGHIRDGLHAPGPRSPGLGGALSTLAGAVAFIGVSYRLYRAAIRPGSSSPQTLSDWS